jgi:uncharacterized protein (TIGR02231 family)
MTSKRRDSASHSDVIFSLRGSLCVSLEFLSLLACLQPLPPWQPAAYHRGSRLNAGEQTLLVDDITGQAILPTIRVEANATGKLEIGSVDARSVGLSSSDPARAQSARKKIEDQIEALTDSRAVQDDIIRAAEMQRLYLENLTKLPETPAGSSTPASREDWRALFNLIGTSMGEAGKSVAEAKLKQREIDRQLEDLRKELTAAGGKFENRTEVRIYVSAAEPLEALVTLRYQVPMASWTAFYDARLVTGDKDKGSSPSLTLIRRASVLQTAGEDWNDVTLALSATRPGATTAAPELNMLSVDFAAEASKLKASEGAGNSSYGQSPAQGMSQVSGQFDGRLELDENRPATTVPYGGKRAADKPAVIAATAFQAVYHIPGRTTIKTSGEEKRLQIMAEDIEPAMIVQTVPRFDHTAYLYARLTLPAASSPLLPGNVSLFRDGVFAGMGQMPQLSPGEEHDLGFGADERVKVKRTITENKKGETGTFSTSRVEERRYAILVKNLHTRAIEIHVIDRIPVSMQQDIAVEFSAGKGPEPSEKDMNGKRGMLMWQMTAAPGEEKQIAFGYRVTAPANKPIWYSETGEVEDQGRQIRLNKIYH